LPGPRVGVTIRPGVQGDFAFIDGLQKQQKKAVGFMFEGAIRGHIDKGNVLIAEATPGRQGVGSRESGVGQGSEGDRASDGSDPTADSLLPTPSPAAPVGYLIGADRYLKRDELGVIFQMNVRPAYRRSLVAANLLKAQFDRSAYGCRLYCCWCAQDLAANKFWEAMGFVPLAFRTGGGRRKGFDEQGRFKGRMHIFWQKKIRPRTWDERAGAWVEDDYSYWFPSQTGSGAIGEDRIVLPIPPGTHWSDAKPVVLPTGSVNEEALLLEERVGALEKAKKELGKGARRAGAAGGGKTKPKPVKSVAAGGLHFGPRTLTQDEAAANEREAQAKAAQDEAAAVALELKEAKRAARRAKKKFDPAQEAFARELKDRWLEAVAARPGLLAPAPGTAKYDVTRGIEGAGGGSVPIGDSERLRLPDAA